MYLEKSRIHCFLSYMRQLFAPFFQGLILRGWIDLKSQRDQSGKRAVKFFDEVLNRFLLAIKFRSLL